MRRGSPAGLPHNHLVFDFGIDGYRPVWLRGYAATAAAHGPRLTALVGRALQRVWLVWDLDDDEWFADCPVLLDFGTDQVEVNHWKLDELSVTWNSIDPSRPVTWADFRLAWRPEPLPQLAPLPGQPLQRVELLEWTGGDMGNGSVDLQFVFPATYLTVHNGMDENGLSFDPPGPHHTRH